MFEQTFKNIDDILHKDAGCGSELDYIEQTSWVLFLKYLDDLEQDRKTIATLSATLIKEEFSWKMWASKWGNRKSSSSNETRRRFRLTPFTGILLPENCIQQTNKQTNKQPLHRQDNEKSHNQPFLRQTSFHESPADQVGNTLEKKQETGNRKQLTGYLIGTIAVFAVAFLAYSDD